MNTLLTRTLLLILTLVLAVACDKAGNGDKFLGKWTSPDWEMTISRDGKLFVSEVVSRRFGLSGIQGKHVGKLGDGSLKFDLGEANLSTDGSKIYWVGSEWQKN